MHACTQRAHKPLSAACRAAAAGRLPRPRPHAPPAPASSAGHARRPLHGLLCRPRPAPRWLPSPSPTGGALLLLLLGCRPQPLDAPKLSSPTRLPSCGLPASVSTQTNPQIWATIADGCMMDGVRVGEKLVQLSGGERQAFIDNAFSLTTHNRCPCNKHNNRHFWNKEKLAKDLVNFTLDYQTWTFHGEKETRVELEGEADDDSASVDRMDGMLEALQPEFGLNSEDPPTKDVEEFFKLLKASEDPLHEHTKVFDLAFVTRHIAIKSKYFFLNQCFNDLVQLIGDVLPQPHKLPNDMYQCKRLTKSLGMGYEKIDMCLDNCMLFWDDHKDEKRCLRCGEGRYVEVVNEDGKKMTMDIAQKQLRSLT
ncbi:LOW QUALITY PROTEIN: hypothetical protein U9M48_012398 [Paspalum notatum var. saurae]|uniref:Transposase-associated domain-containing protein n=1 Tax=Paspalum notatum var. saurae TaxID=547442 RepID=A0AAQ3WII5_PASNO